MTRTVRGVALLLLTVALRPVAAQGNDNPALCWEPRPAPACRRTLIVEVGAAASLTSSHVGYLTSELGVMRTTAARGAVGVSLFTALLDDDGRLGVKLRYRRWVGNRTVVEAGAGPLLLNATFRAHNLGLVAHTSLGYRDWVAATVQLELAGYEQRGMESRVFLGVRTGSYFGFGGNLLAGTLVLVALSMSDPFDHTK